MPQIIVKGVKKEEMAPMSTACAPVLAEIVKCPADWFVFEYQDSVFFDVTGQIPHWPVIQVWWFARPQDVQDEVAVTINNYLKTLGYPGSQISFHLFAESAYYEEGEHF